MLLSDRDVGRYVSRLLATERLKQKMIMEMILWCYDYYDNDLMMNMIYDTRTYLCFVGFIPSIRLAP